jgi:hypothetical protein
MCKHFLYGVMSGVEQFCILFLMKINKAVSKIEGGPSPVACVVGTV